MPEETGPRPGKEPALGVSRIVRGSGLRWILFAVITTIYLWVFFFLGTHLVHQTNQDRLNWDQQHNIHLAEIAKQRAEAPPSEADSVTNRLWQHLPHYTDGVVNPLWPWVAARFSTEDHEAFFERGKWFNLILTATFIVLLGVFSLQRLSLPATINVMLVAGLGALLPRAPFFQPEPLFYIFFFLSWICCLVLMRRNPLWLYGALGVTSGLAYLAKGSVQLLLLVFLAVSSGRFLARWYAMRKYPDETRDRWNLANHFIGVACLAAGFLMVAGPRLNYANQYYGDPFHSYPSYWMWVDGFEEGAAFMQTYQNKEDFAKLPPEEKPSPFNYLKSHTIEQCLERMWSGTKAKTLDFLLPKEIKQNKEHNKPWREILPLRGWYLAYLWLAASLMVLWWKALRPPEERIASVPRLRHGWMVGFVFLAFAAYAMAYGWYTPVGKGNRFMLSLFLPMVFTFVWLGEELRTACARVKPKTLANTVSLGLNLLLTAAVTWRIIELVRTPLFKG